MMLGNPRQAPKDESLGAFLVLGHPPKMISKIFDIL